MVECAQENVKIWSPSADLSPRVAALREQYFQFATRDFKNEVIPFGTGTPWDMVYVPHAWAIVPEVIPLINAFADSLVASAYIVPLDKNFWEKPRILRRANFFSKVVSKYLPIDILDGEMIIGGQFNAALSLCMNKEETKFFNKEEKRFFEKLKQLNELGVGNCGATSGHLIPDYPTVLRIGMKGLIQKAEDKKKEAKSQEHRDLLEAMQITLKAAIALSHRYAEKARELAEKEADKVRAAELRKIADICDRVPENPPKTFHEAIQSLWITHMLIMTQESYPGPGLSPGRIDQYLYPYYKADLDNGNMTREQAFELICCWFVKFNYAYDFQGRVGNNQGITSAYGQLITLAGIDKDGNDASNDLTWLLLDAIEKMNLLEPKPNVRIHANTSDALVKRVAELVAKAQGSPFLLNFDEKSIEGLRWEGLPEEDLWDYAPVGCLENTLQGNDRSGTVDVNANLAKAIEFACFDGKDLQSGVQMGPKTGDPRTFATFDEFYEAVKIQTRQVMKLLIDTNDISDLLRAQYAQTPYLSALVKGCMDSGKDITAGGAEHNFITIEGIAFATAADSILAVKHLIYDTKKFTWDEMLDALKNDFKGYEKLQAFAKNRAPKYGNDDEQGDAIARDYSQFWNSEIFKFKSPTGKRYRAGYLSWNYWVSYAPFTAATPNGRPRGQFLSNGICASNGADEKGPTAAIRSVGAVGLETAPNGASHTLSFSPSLLRDDEHINKFASMLRAYGKEGGTALQINVVDADTLRAAQKNPDEYRNLLVRVTGYNAYFTQIGRELQNELIARTEHNL